MFTSQTCAVRKVLDKLANQKVPLLYHLYESSSGFAGFVDDLCNPEVIGSDKFQALRIALRKYNETLGQRLKLARKEEERLGDGLIYADDLQRFTGKNALIIIDFADRDYDGTDKLAVIAKTVRDNNYPVRFVFIASETRTPAILQRRVRHIRLVESNNALAEDYLERIVKIKDLKQIQDIVQFTGSMFKYLTEVKSVWPQDRPGTSSDVEGLWIIIRY